MKEVAQAAIDHLRQEVTTLALCWVVTKGNGEIIRGTTHDRDLQIDDGDLAGLYLAGANIAGSDVVSGADMSVDNLDVDGAFPESITIPDITLADVEAGWLNNAPVTMFFVNWEDPNAWQTFERVGWLGELEWDSSGQYRTEVRGLTQRLAQNVMRTYGDRCDVARFGDTRCGFNVAAVTITATVSGVTNRRVFIVSGITSEPIGYFSGGRLLGVTGANAGIERQIKLDAYAALQGQLQLFEAFPLDVEIGDTFSMAPGCDRAMSTCRDRFNNLVNFRGHGVYIPGIAALLRGPA